MTSATSATPNLFEEVLTDAQGVQERLLGPTYPYYKSIKTPSQLGMSSHGSLETMGKDIDGLVQYVQVLVSGDSRASVTGHALGNKFFLKTGGKCTDASGELQDRYIYINNVPAGNIPFISSGMDANFTEFRGLIPGTMSNLNALNPFAIMGAFMTGAEPACEAITMETVTAENVRGTATNYVATVDIKNMDPCWFSDGRNPASGAQCRETFGGAGSAGYSVSPLQGGYAIPGDRRGAGVAVAAEPVPSLNMGLGSQLFLAGLAGLGVYMAYRLSTRRP